MVHRDCIVRIWTCNSVKEVTNLPYKSTKNCLKLADGFELRDACLWTWCAHYLAALQLLSFMAEHKDSWKGTVILSGQPAEVTYFGAEAIGERWFIHTMDPEPDFLFGLHNEPLPQHGSPQLRDKNGPAYRSAWCTFYGKVGHGSTP